MTYQSTFVGIMENLYLDTHGTLAPANVYDTRTVTSYLLLQCVGWSMAHERNQIIMFQCVSWFDLFEYLKKFVKVVVDMKELLIVTWDVFSLYNVPCSGKIHDEIGNDKRRAEWRIPSSIKRSYLMTNDDRVVC